MGKLRVNERCIGCGLCPIVASEVFELKEEDNLARVKLNIAELEKYKNYIKGSDTDIDNAIDSCLAGAIVHD